MPVFFNGRLLVSPAVASLVDDEAMANHNLAVGNVVALIGTSDGGTPNTALRFNTPSAARAVLRSGTLLTAVEKAFAASNVLNGPQTVVAVRVNPATRASLNLQASSANVIALTATDYGLWTNQIKVKVEAASTKGKRLTTQVGSDYYTQDNVYRDAFSVVYTGTESTATITISNSTVTLAAPAGSTVATIDLESYPTVTQLVDRINALVSSGWLAGALDGNDDRPALNGLDTVTAHTVKTDAYTVTANLQACVDWFNSVGEGFVTATRVTNAGAAPDALTWTYFAGGANGTTTTTEWTNALTMLQSVDVQWVVPLTSNAAIHSGVDAHVVLMSQMGRERRACVGGAAGQTQAEVKVAAKLINSDRTAQCFPGYWDYNAAGVLTLYPSYMTAALIAAGFAGSDPGVAMTNKTFRVRGVETAVANPAESDEIIRAGVCLIEETAAGYRCVKSVSTWLRNTNYNRVEVSVGFATDYTARSVREALQRFIGERGSPLTLALAASATETALRELARPAPAGPGILVGDSASPAYRNISSSLDGDVLRVEFECSPVIPINYILITIHIQPYSGTVTAAQIATA
jgi:hypothetical protein